MIVFLDWEEGPCQTKVWQYGTSYKQDDITQEECEEFCKKTPGATGCEYQADERTPWCLAFTYPIYVERKKGSEYRCLVFEGEHFIRS